MIQNPINFEEMNPLNIYDNSWVTNENTTCEFSFETPFFFYLKCISKLAEKCLIQIMKFLYM